MMTNNTFTSNTVPGIGAGGAVFGPVGQFLSVTFDSNSAYDGGAVQVSPDSRFEVALLATFHITPALQTRCILHLCTCRSIARLAVSQIMSLEPCE